MDDPLLREVPVLDGHKFLDPALLMSRIGQGGMGAVYRGKHRTLRIDVAVKCLKPHLIGDHPHAMERFAREARLTAQLSHQNLVRLYEYRKEHGLHYLVLEFVDGETARERVRRKGPMSEASAARVVLAVARGLAVAHRHPECIVHRDLKPENVLISRRGEVKLADLGLAKAMERLDASTFATDGTVGTPRYMAPEQWSAKADLTPRADVWSLGATLYFLLIGEDGLQGTTLSAICGEAQSGSFPDPRHARPGLSAEIASIVRRCTRLDPAVRPADAVELARELQTFLARREPPSSPMARALGPLRRRPARAAVGLVLLVAASSWLLMRRSESGPVRAGSSGPPMSTSRAVIDPETQRLKPEEDWEVLDGSQGWDNWAPRVREPRSGIVFVLIPPGEYERGSPRNEPGRGEFETLHRVIITRPFYMAEHETSNEQLRRIKADESDEYPESWPARGNWHGARAFCNTIGCELPTEAQWEYAARAGSSSAYVWGPSPEALDGKGNVLDRGAAGMQYGLSGLEVFEFDDGHPDLAPVKSYAPNAFGLYDMLGNVREWCYDGYKERYEELPEQDPMEPPIGPNRVLRGGSCLSGPEEARAAARHARPSREAFDDYGFRAVRNL